MHPAAPYSPERGDPLVQPLVGHLGCRERQKRWGEAHLCGFIRVAVPCHLQFQAPPPPAAPVLLRGLVSAFLLTRSPFDLLLPLVGQPILLPASPQTPCIPGNPRVPPCVTHTRGSALRRPRPHGLFCPPLGHKGTGFTPCSRFQVAATWWGGRSPQTL